MSESKFDENLIATLEQSLRQTRNVQNRLLDRLREVETEAERLRQEIGAMDNSAEQTEAAIYSLLATMRSGSKSRNLMKKFQIDENYQLPDDLRTVAQRKSQVRGDVRAIGSRREEFSRDERYRDEPVNYLDESNSGNSRGVPSISRNLEPISNRFSDRTITQACTLILSESRNPLHVNELYNLLVAGGFKFSGKNPTISIAVSLNRNKRFEKVAPGTFDLVLRDASQAAS